MHAHKMSKHMRHSHAHKTRTARMFEEKKRGSVGFTKGYDNFCVALVFDGAVVLDKKKRLALSGKFANPIPQFPQGEIVLLLRARTQAHAAGVSPVPAPMAFPTDMTAGLPHLGRSPIRRGKSSTNQNLKPSPFPSSFLSMREW